ncbi:D-amino acid dehydrogenase [Advenella sp. RU8]|uniref:D-amino acid dehydrogenase n=1 Tax=Advenella sp. RU8 TaxID=3399575 RepID=UPI003AB008BC
MEILILGAGVIGLTTAYYLTEQGHKVSILDKNPDVGLETSYANGAQLSYSYVAPLAGPGVIGKVPKWLLDPDSPLRFRPSLDPADICWNLRFMKACNASQSDKTTRELLQLSFLSRDLLHHLLDTEKLDIDFQASGKMVLHRSTASFNSAVQLLDFQRQLGCEQFALNTDECITKEPALAPLKNQITGGIYTPSEEAADCFKFCQNLKTLLLDRGVEFLFNHEVGLLKSNGSSQVSVILKDRQSLSADHIVVALGCESTALLKPLHIDVPVRPLKGYSLTLPIENDSQAPHVSITDFERKVVYARIGKRLRIAGMADLVGMNKSIDPNRLKTLINEAKAVFPDVGNYAQAEQWAGLRPATPKGKPIIDGTRYKNLWLNIGQGALGFTLATGSGKLLAEKISGKKSSVPDGLFSLGNA